MLKAETHPKPTPGIKLTDMYLRVFNTTKRAVYIDQPCCFPITSAGGHKYTMVAVELDGNYIDAESMKSRTHVSTYVLGIGQTNTSGSTQINRYSLWKSPPRALFRVVHSKSHKIHFGAL